MVHEIIARGVALAVSAFLFMPLAATWRAYRLGCRPVVDSGLDVIFLCGVTVLALAFLVLAILG